jgi:hypothetical protein
MMRAPCFEPDDAGRVAALEASDPLRVHARECPRCRALLDAYAAFMAAEPAVVPAAELADANARLSRAILSATARQGRGGEPVVERAASGAEAADGPRPRGLLERLAHPAMRPAWAFVTVAIVVAGVVLWPRAAGHDGTSALRGGSVAAAPDLRRAEWSGDELRLAWAGAPGADAFELRFFSTALSELGRTGPYRDSTLVLALSSLPFRAAFGDSVVVRVVALKDGDAVATSDARLLARGPAAR